MSDDGFAALSAAVLLRAIKDANGQTDGIVSRPQVAELRRCACAFLSPDDALFPVYCGLLDLDPDATASAAKLRGRNVARKARRRERRG